MTWSGLDDGFYDNPKILSVSLAAAGLHASIISYCNKHMTDGRVSEPVTRLLSRNQPELVIELVTGLLLHENGVGFVVHDFLDYNLSRADILERRRKTREKVAAWRAEHRNPVTGQFHPQSNPLRNPTPLPSPPLPLPELGKRETDLEPRSPTAPVSVTPGHARSRTTIPQFHRPTVEQVRAYAAEMGYEDFDPLGFVAYYESVGWKRGKTPMKNWKAAVVTWMRRQ